MQAKNKNKRINKKEDCNTCRWKGTCAAENDTPNYYCPRKRKEKEVLGLN